jgi:hypothetical protein
MSAIEPDDRLRRRFLKASSMLGHSATNLPRESNPVRIVGKQEVIAEQASPGGFVRCV